MNGDIVGVLHANKRGRPVEIVVRYPEMADLTKIFAFDNKVRKETKFLDIVSPISKKNEIQWFRGILASIRKKDCVHLLAVHNGIVVGACTVRRQKEETYRHVGVYDLVVRKSYWRLGVGSLLTERIIALARNKLKLKLLRLILYSGNKPAEKLYKKFGFRVVGRIPNGVIHSGTRMDEIIFYKTL